MDRLFSVNDEKIKVLQHLGLTFRQAKVYLALVELGIASAKAVSQVSDVTRQDVYQILFELQDFGLVEQGITRPTRFSLISVNEGLTILMERKKEELSELEKKTTTLLCKFRENKKEPHLNCEKQFVLVPEKEATRFRANKALEQAQVSNDCVIRREALEYALNRDDENFKKALNKGVKFRYIICGMENHEILKIDRAFKNNPRFLIRYSTNPCPAQIVVIDNKTACVSTGPNGGITAPTLWSTNPTIVSLLHDYFNMLWKCGRVRARFTEPI